MKWGSRTIAFIKYNLECAKFGVSIKFCLQRVLGVAVILDNVTVLLCKYKVLFLFGGMATVRSFMDWKEYLKQIVSLSLVIGPTEVKLITMFKIEEAFNVTVLLNEGR